MSERICRGTASRVGDLRQAVGKLVAGRAQVHVRVTMHHGVAHGLLPTPEVLGLAGVAHLFRKRGRCGVVDDVRDTRVTL